MNEHTPEPAPDLRPPDEASEDTPQAVIFEDLRLNEVLAYLFWRPVRTARLLWDMLRADPDAVPGLAPVIERKEPPGRDDSPPDDTQPIEPPLQPRDEPDGPAEPRDPAIWLRLGALAIGIVLALVGGAQLYGGATDPAAHAAGRTNGALWWFGLAALLVVAGEIYAGRIRRRGVRAIREPAASEDDTDEVVFRVRSVVAVPAPIKQPPTAHDAPRASWLRVPAVALALLSVALILSLL